jgi:hypothetical protein
MAVTRLDFDNIKVADLQELVDAGATESQVLEFKRDAYGSADADKKELLKDVSSFANMHGGHLVIGIEGAQGVADYRMNAYMKRVKELNDPTASVEYKRFQEMLALFEKYGGKYNFDPLMLAAQGYQESQLNQNAKSAVGAIGVMQIMPATGEQMKVGDIRVTESNIHAAAKYMDHLMTQYLADANLSEGNRTLSRSRATTAVPETSPRRAGKPRGATWTPTSGSTTSRSSSRSRSVPRQRPTFATSTSTTFPTA